MLKILVATNLASVRDLVATACGAVEDMSVEYLSSVRELERKAAATAPSQCVVLLDASLSEFTADADLVRAAERLARFYCIALLNQGENGEGLWRQVRFAGVRGLLPHDIDATQLRLAIQLVVSDLSVVLSHPPERHVNGHGNERLSERELQVLAGICNGLQNKEIAHGFNIKEVTVKMHVRAIIRKLGAKNRTHAAMIARDRGLGY